MAFLSITAENFFDMAPVELYHAFTQKAEQNEQDFRLQMLAARFQAWATGVAGRVKKLADSPQKFLPFTWEEPKMQSVEEMKQRMLAVASIQNKRVAQEEAERKQLENKPPPKTMRRK